MTDLYNPPDLSAIQAMIAANSLQFVRSPQLPPLTMDELHTQYPPGSTYSGQYARVVNIYGSIDDVMRCRYDGVAYRWVPQRENYAVENAQASGTMNITPLLSPPAIFLTATSIPALTTLTLNMVDNGRAYIGQRQRIRTPPSILGSLIVTGLSIANLNLGGAQDRFLEYTASGWRG